MEQHEKEKLIRDITEFESRKDEYSPIDAENKLIKILTPLLESDGYNLAYSGGPRDNGIDFLATKQQRLIGIQYKHYKSNVGASAVRELIGSALVNKLDKVILLTSSSFSTQARETASLIDPISVELLDINDLKTWTSKIEANYDESEVTQVLKTFTQKIIELINKTPRTLDELEWRDLERVIAEVFNGIGFNVTLTPASKDGGKDVILECFSQGTKKTFIIEIKHWRSGQKVGEKSIKDFVKIITTEKRNAGLFLSTYGYTQNAVESLTEIEKQKVRFGQETKIVSLCKTYMKRKSGIWDNEQDLADILLYDTT
jgi:HJR/Mrr/RecB family endonuclease